MANTMTAGCVFSFKGGFTPNFWPLFTGRWWEDDEFNHWIWTRSDLGEKKTIGFHHPEQASELMMIGHEHFLRGFLRRFALRMWSFDRWTRDFQDSEIGTSSSQFLTFKQKIGHIKWSCWYQSWGCKPAAKMGVEICSLLRWGILNVAF